MKSAVLAAFDQMWLPLLGLIIFVTVFVVMLFHVFRKESSNNYEEAQLLPLDEGVRSEKK